MFDSKDADRIAVIMNKQNPIAAAQNMANVIKDADKAERRAAAARSFAANTSIPVRASQAREVARIFATRAEDIIGAVGVAPKPMPEVVVQNVVFRAKEQREAKPRVYFFDESKTNALDMIAQRYLPKALFNEAIQEVLEPIGLRGVAYKWSATAGCACKCSPGFIVDDSRYGFDVFVHYTLKEGK